MDNIYKLLKTKASLVNVLLLGCVGFSSIITLERPDYNLFLFLFVAFSIFWKNSQLSPNPKIIAFERMLCTITMTASLLVDLIWIYTHKEINSSYIIYMSWIEFFIKIIIIGIVYIMWQGYKKEGYTANIEGTGFKQFEEEEAWNKYKYFLKDIWGTFISNNQDSLNKNLKKYLHF